MKIGLLTYYGDLNCGTNLQALATLQALRSTYPHDEVEVIPLHGFKQCRRPYKTFSPVDLYHEVKRFRKYDDFKVKMLGVSSDKTITDVGKALEYIASRHYDAIYVGADTLLELDRVPSGYDGISAYWLKGINAKKVMIAASSKNVAFEGVSVAQRQELVVAASQFDYIGIRDRATQHLLEQLLECSGSDKKIHYVPDPTFTYDIDYSYIDSYLKHRHVTIPEKSVFVQFYGSDTWLVDVTRDLKRRGYTIITNRRVAWTDIILIDMSPLEQVGLYKYVDFVITHRFHDGVFCMKNHTPALIYVKSGQQMMTGGEGKHVSLLKDFGLYPQAFLGALDSPEGLKDVWQSYEAVRQVFDEDKIESVLQKNKTAYMEYVNLTCETNVDSKNIR